MSTEQCPMASQSEMNAKSQRQTHKKKRKQQRRLPLTLDLRLKDGIVAQKRNPVKNADESSTATKSTAAESIINSCNWSSTSISMGSDFMMAPLNDLGGGSSHSYFARDRRSKSSYNHNSSYNSLAGERGSHHTRGSNAYSNSYSSLAGERGSYNTLGSNNSNSSFGESSLSSFMSVLLEHEESKSREISIVSDNPKPETKSIRELRLSFIRSAYKNDRPKCRWEYLTRDNNDRDQMSRSRRRSMLEARSVSFSGAISNTKESINSESNGALNSLMTNQKRAGTKSAAGMFLRMPERKNSPMTEAVKKKSLMSRCENMSDTDLALLPMEPGSTSPTKRSATNTTSTPANSRHSRILNGEPPEPKGMTRSGDHKEDIGNAMWSKADMRAVRRRNSDQFLDFLLEPDGDAANSGWPSPMPSPSPRLNKASLVDLSTSFFSLDDSSDEEEDITDEEEETESILEKHTCYSQPPQTPIDGNSAMMASRQQNHKNSLENCYSRPPQIPTRKPSPCSVHPVSPRATSRRKQSLPKIQIPSPSVHSLLSSLPMGKSLPPTSPRKSPTKKNTATAPKAALDILNSNGWID